MRKFLEIRGFFRKHGYFSALQIACALIAIWWIPHDNLPLPGISVAIIAIPAAAMSIHTEMEGWQKFVWMALIGAFLATEMRAIKSDRENSDAQTAVRIKAENDSFALVLKTEASAIDKTLEKFDAQAKSSGDILEKAREIGKISAKNLLTTEENLKNITGGNSFAYISPQIVGAVDSIPLVIWNSGDYTLTGVNVVIYRTTKQPWEKFDENIGTIPHDSPHFLLQLMT